MLRASGDELRGKEENILSNLFFPSPRFTFASVAGLFGISLGIKSLFDCPGISLLYLGSEAQIDAVMPEMIFSISTFMKTKKCT